MKMAIEVTTDLNIENTKLVLDGLCRCRGIDQYNVYIHVDDGCQGMLDMLRNHPLGHVRFLKAFRIGRDCNVYAAMEHGFQDADYVVHLDDTAVPHDDFIHYHEHCSGLLDEQSALVAVSSHAMGVGTDKLDRDIDEIRFTYLNSFDPSAWGTWKSVWKEFFQKNWHKKNCKSWVWAINDKMDWKTQIYPDTSFCDRIPAQSAVAA